MPNRNPSVLLVGCGSLGLLVADALLSENWHVSAVRRNPPETPLNIQWFAADYTESGSLSFAQDLKPDYVVATLTPAAMDVDGYQRGFAGSASNLLRGLAEHRTKHLLMVSSTRVYAETAGGWVDEDSPLALRDPRASAIIDAELTFQQSGHPATAVRCGGIYGSLSNRLISRVATGKIAPSRPTRYTNRIHQQDCALFLVHLLTLSNQGKQPAQVYNCVDDSPAAAYEVETWLANAVGANSRADNNSAPRGHKRCRNTRMHKTGYKLAYPNYRAGYTQLLEDRKYRPEYS